MRSKERMPLDGTEEGAQISMKSKILQVLLTLHELAVYRGEDDSFAGYARRGRGEERGHCPGVEDELARFRERVDRARQKAELADDAIGCEMQVRDALARSLDANEVAPAAEVLGPDELVLVRELAVSDPANLLRARPERHGRVDLERERADRRVHGREGRSVVVECGEEPG